MSPAAIRSAMLRTGALALLLLLVLVGVLTLRTLQRLPNAMIYLVRSEPDHFTLVPVPRTLSASTPEARLRASLEALIAGPTPEEAAQGLTSALDPATRVRAVQIEGARATVDLSNEFTRGGGSALMSGRLYQLLYTASQPHSIAEVVLLVEGEPLLALGGEGLLVPSPWRRPAGGLPRW